MNKYHAKKTEVDGIVFDSQKEARRWRELLLLQRAKEISGLDRQIKLSVDVNDIHICNYFADYTYVDSRTKRQVYEDCKSAMTRKLSTYRLKKKLVKAVLGIEILET